MNAREGNSRHGWIAYGYIQGYILQSHTRESSSHHGWIAYGYIQGAYIAKIHAREGSSRHGWIAYGYIQDVYIAKIIHAKVARAMGGLPMDIMRHCSNACHQN